MMALPSPDQVAASLHAFTVDPVQLGALIALATLVSEDLACIAAGLLAARGDLSLPTAILAALVGIVAGDLLLYVAGRAAGPAVLRRRPFSRWISLHRIEQARAALSRWGGPALVGARFVPGLRLPTYVAAGVVAMDAVTFTLWITLGAALWTPLLVSAAAGSGSVVHGLGPWALVGAAVVGLLAAPLDRPLVDRAVVLLARPPPSARKSAPAAAVGLADLVVPTFLGANFLGWRSSS